MFDSPFSPLGPDITARELIEVTHFIHHVVTGPESEPITGIVLPSKGFTGFVILIGGSEEEPPQFEPGGGIQASGVLAYNVATFMVNDGQGWWPSRTE
jgi:hypothetical protein